MPIDMQLSQITDCLILLISLSYTSSNNYNSQRQRLKILCLKKSNICKNSHSLLMSNPNYNIVEVVHTYDPVITTDSSIKLSKLWAGPYYVVEKLFPIHVKLHKIHDNKLIFNKVHVNRLKRSCLQSGLIDAQPPPPPPPRY